MLLLQETEFFDWINPVYISQEIQNDIRERFESESELELSDFLKVSMATVLFAALIFLSCAFSRRLSPAEMHNSYGIY